jgi:hypothetical protein
MQATHTALLTNPNLPRQVRQAYLFQEMQNKCLLSLGQFCDNGYEVRLSKEQIHIQYMTDPNMSLRGHHDPMSKMWTVDIANTNHTTNEPVQHTRPMANNVYEHKKKADIVQYLHKAAFSPVKSTWIQAIQAGFYTTWPNLTVEMVEKHLEKSPATVKGHLRQIRQNLRSTATTATPIDTNVMTMSSHEDIRENLVSIKIVEVAGKVFTDQTGRFPVNSSKENKYIMVMYDNDTNAILAEAMKSRTQDEIVRAQAHLHGMLTKIGFKPHVQILDNKCPAKLEDFLRKQQVDFQLVPPYLHRTNAAERAIATFKDHFIAGLASADPAFPMHLWC